VLFQTRRANHHRGQSGAPSLSWWRSRSTAPWPPAPTACNRAKATPDDWITTAALSFIGAGIILHIGIGLRWPFAPKPKQNP
jgi:hypothetical protein